MMPIWHKLRLVFIAAASVLYIALGYLATSSAHPNVLVLLVGLGPFVVVTLFACWRSTLRYPLMIICSLGLVFALLRPEAVISHVSWIYFLQHAGTMVVLGISFGSTLRTHEGALCSRVAKFAGTGVLDDHFFHYTWKVTLAWTIYFAVCAIASIVLFVAAPLGMWSIFAAVVTPVSVGAMFVVEYFIRRRVLPDHQVFSIAHTIQSYRNYSEQQNAIAKTSHWPGAGKINQPES